MALAPATGAAPTLGALPGSSEASGGGEASSCPVSEGTGSIPLPLTPGTQTKILPSGLAAAGEEAPQAVKKMVAAGNRLFSASYLYGGAHGTSLDTLQPAYDCSSAVSYVLHWGGVLGTSALDSTELASYGQPGPGQYVSIYANAGHAFMYVGGLRFDTVEDAAYDSGPNSGKPGPRWRVYPIRPRLGELDRPTPIRPMSRHAVKALIPVCAAAGRSGARGLHQSRRAQLRAGLGDRLAAEHGRASGTRAADACRSGPRWRAADTREGACRLQRALLELDVSHAELKPAKARRDVCRHRRDWPSSRPLLRAGRTRRSPAGTSTTAVRSSASLPMPHVPVRGSSSPVNRPAATRSTKGCRPATTSPSRSSRMSPAATP